MTPALVDTATEIRTEHEAAQRCASEAVAHAIRAGELLLEAKAALPHGEFGAWLAANVECSARTAQGYIRLAKLDDEKRNAVADLSLRSALHRVTRDAIDAKRKEEFNRRDVEHAQFRGNPETGDGPVSVEHLRAGSWCVRIGPNAVGAKLNPMAWNDAADEVLHHDPALAKARDDMASADRDVDRIERELREANDRLHRAIASLKAAAFRRLEQVHGIPEWGRLLTLRIPAEWDEAVLIQQSDKMKWIALCAVPGIEQTGALICGDFRYFTRDVCPAPS